MKRLVQVTLVALMTVSTARAQDELTFSQANPNVAADFANSSAATSLPKFADALFSAEPRVASSSWIAEPPSLALAAEALAAAPDPKFVYGSRDDFRLPLALVVTVLRVRSSKYYASGVGTNTSLTYLQNEWF